MATSTIPKPMYGTATDKLDNSNSTIAYKVGSTVFVTCGDFNWYSDAQGVIHKGSASGPAWTLPDGFRPPNIVEFADARFGKRMRILTTGEIISVEALSNVGLRFSATFLSDARFN